MPKQMIDFEVYLVHVDPERCEGCGECVKICPTDVFEVTEKSRPVRPRHCLGCGTCMAVCSSKAVVITEI